VFAVVPEVNNNAIRSGQLSHGRGCHRIWKLTFSDCSQSGHLINFYR
jgi:hypothetical protein